jgi:peptidoglycan/LPS O-acetylase OafA/YrhL
MDLPDQRPRLPALTSLRFFAAFHVVMFHLYTMHILEGRGLYRKLASIGYVGVSLFFVLSGFILVYTYAGRDWTWGEFWRARFARVYPAYLFSLLLTAPGFFYVCLKLKDMDIPYFAWFKTHLVLSSTLVPLLLQSWVPGAALAWNGPAWSLSVEAFFYLVFPFLVVRLMRSNKTTLAWILCGCWLISLALSAGYWLLKPDGVAQTNDQFLNLMWLNTLKFNPLSRLPEFVMGACCGFLFLRSAVERKWATPLLVGGLVLFVAVAVASPSIPYPILHNSSLSPAFAAIIFGLALRPEWTSFLGARPLVLLGDASYTLYLLHSFILSVYFSPFGQLRHISFWGITIGLSLPLVISLLVYRWIEEPARRKLRPKKATPVQVMAE